MSRYGGNHQAVRRAGLASAYGTPCVRCGRLMHPGQQLDLDHRDDGPGWLGFAHARCNRQAGGRKGRAAQMERKRQMEQKQEAVLAVEVTADRDLTALVGCRDRDGLPFVFVAGLLQGTHLAVGEVAAIAEERKLRTVVVDPHSHGANLIEPLRQARQRITEVTATDLASAHGDFLDMLGAGQLRHDGHQALRDAARRGMRRKLGGASAWDERGVLTAATLALWGWRNTVSLGKPRIIVPRSPA